MLIEHGLERYLGVTQVKEAVNKATDRLLLVYFIMGREIGRDEAMSHKTGWIDMMSSGIGRDEVMSCKNGRADITGCGINHDEVMSCKTG